MKKVLVALTALLAVCLPASASLFWSMSQDELIDASDTIVVGRVLETRSFWNSQRTAVLTEALVAVEESVAGEPPASIPVYTLGGEIGGYTYVAVGAPRFRPGERFLLFLRTDRKGAFRVVGLEQGQYEVVATDAGAELAVPRADAHHLVAKGGRAASPLRPLKLDALRQRVRERRQEVNHER
jgi:hypothetical protein